uniref:Uncharacterized protein n=1 Tax=Fibrocapsa japonica TaxID=94617 RepID=A0A7S2UZJ3_9STRA|mmetsp:Transcript_18260/g.26573  ORF Transcript_18260/g.26573 Transcript_18260/m.26573 type:complete len:256 (+) Transcript_18260:67-834(+)|eukprot:CAMPEP_0113936194 /NCGR_PEP_ID=MMETSP1339-20121228/3162_1 /TAXON_ID=94617 /ORGANISM="Fibrocapsa japonica" /LENGTH=255 /DNA_ID=CAMNT_0000938579 /DNA_START=16 /DNA_END=783 /DNA_ORIENTATION=+ /assembly_acc=CAM_ASM_000762
MMEPDAKQDPEQTALEVELCNACLQGRLGDVYELLKSGVNPNASNKYGSTPLILASIKGYRDIVELMLEHGAEIDLTGPEGWTALHGASFFGHTKLVCFLILKGADPLLENNLGKIPGMDFDSSLEMSTCLEIRGLLDKASDGFITFNKGEEEEGEGPANGKRHSRTASRSDRQDFNIKSVVEMQHTCNTHGSRVGSGKGRGKSAPGEGPDEDEACLACEQLRLEEQAAFGGEAESAYDDEYTAPPHGCCTCAQS